MNGFPSRAEVERTKAAYPAGTRIELIRMDDRWSSLKAGDRGTVQTVDDAGTIHMRWDSGSGLGLVPGEDAFMVVSE